MNQQPTRAFVWQVKKGMRLTTNIPLAISIAKETGKAPCNYLSKKVRDYAVKINPALKKRFKKSV